MRKRGTFRLFWTGHTRTGDLVTVYRKLEQRKDEDDTYTLRALTHGIEHDSVVVTNSQDCKKLRDDSACNRQIGRWKQQYRWRAVDPQSAVRQLEQELV
jgi:hypothetical protein